MRRTAPALVLSLVSHAAVILGAAATLPLMSSDALIVELDPLADERHARPSGGAAAAPPLVPSRRTPAVPRPPSVPSAPTPAAPPSTPPPSSAPAPSPLPRVGAAPMPSVDAGPAPTSGESGAAVAVETDRAAPGDAVAATASTPAFAAAPRGAAVGAATTEDGGSVAGPDGEEQGHAHAEGRGATVATSVPGAAGDGDNGGYVAYLVLLRRRIQEALEYPIIARRRGLTGTVHVEIAVRASGAIADVAVIGSSRHRLLDDAAVGAVRAVGRVPFPSGVAPRALRARLPIVFELQ